MGAFVSCRSAHAESNQAFDESERTKRAGANTNFDASARSNAKRFRSECAPAKARQRAASRFTARNPAVFFALSGDPSARNGSGLQTGDFWLRQDLLRGSKSRDRHGTDGFMRAR